MLDEHRFPGGIPIGALGEAALAIASRNRQLRADLGPKHTRQASASTWR